MYRPEAYIEKTKKHLKKISSVNTKIDTLRHSATHALLSRNDVVVVASVSCIFGLNIPKEYIDNINEICVGQEVILRDFYKMLERMLYAPSENDDNFERGQYQIDDHSETRINILLWSPAAKHPMRISMEKVQSSNAMISDKEKPFIIESIGYGDEMGFVPLSSALLFPAKHHIVSNDSLDIGMELIEEEMLQEVKVFRASEKMEEANRLEAIVLRDLETIRNGLL